MAEDAFLSKFRKIAADSRSRQSQSDPINMVLEVMAQKQQEREATQAAMAPLQNQDTSLNVNSGSSIQTRYDMPEMPSITNYMPKQQSQKLPTGGGMSLPVGSPYTGKSRRSVQASNPDSSFGTHAALGEFLKASGLGFNSADHGIGSHSKFVAGTTRISNHTKGDALDISGTPEELQAMVKYLEANSDKLNEIIYSPTGTFLSRGKKFNPSKTTIDNHKGHIHTSAENAELLSQYLAKSMK